MEVEVVVFFWDDEEKYEPHWGVVYGIKIDPFF